MLRISLASALVFACSVIGSAPIVLAETQNAPALYGFTPTLTRYEMAAEQSIVNSPNASTALRDERVLAGRVHRMGQVGDYQDALYVRNRLAADGWNAQLVTYDVAIVWPTQQSLTITVPFRQDVDLYEPPIPRDPYSQNHAAIGKPYSGFSNDGDAQGPLIYVNYGTAADFAFLKLHHINVRGAILLAKMGQGSADSKGRRAEAAGAKAVLIYPEPRWDPYFSQTRQIKLYPDGPGRPLGAALRNTMLIESDPGDPTALSVPVPGAKHKPFSSIKVPSIPVSAVTALVAQELEARLGGPVAPLAWATKLTPGVHIGGSERVHFVLKSKRFIGPIWDVIATMQGSTAPQESVVIGSHRDAWTYGAIDPVSGTVALLQLGDAFAHLRKSGWRPFRTVVIGSWDGEELNDFGSAAWVDQHANELQHTCWAYINTDEVALGPTFFAYATDDLGSSMRAAAAAAIAPDGQTVQRYWAKQDRKEVISPPGLGSDHEPFTYHVGVPSAGIVYGGVFGTYHSAYDDPASLRIFDPGMRFADAAARFYNVLMLRLADAPYPNFRLRDDALALQRRLNAFGNAAGNENRRTQVVRTLQPLLSKFSSLADSIDSAVDQATAINNLDELKTLRRLTFDIRSSFYDSNGVPGHPWQGSVLYNFDDTISTLPSLESTLDPRSGETALNQIASAFQRVPPLLLIYETPHAILSAP